MPPIALAEVQGYVYDAKRRMAGLARVRGETELAIRLDIEADALRARFEEAFWVEDQGYYAMALDGDKRPGRRDRVERRAVPVDRDRRAGAGARRRRPACCRRRCSRAGASAPTRPASPATTRSATTPGTVWPHDTSLIAAGLKRYGFDDAANRLVGPILEAAQHFPEYRLPELFCGFDRDESHIPVPYPVACSPQAWAAGSSFLFLDDDARPARRTPTAASSSCATRTCPTGWARSR